MSLLLPPGFFGTWGEAIVKEILIYRFEIDIPTLSELHSLEMKFFNAFSWKLYCLHEYLFDHSGRWFWVFMYKLTGHCGGGSWGHWPIFGNRHSWLWVDGKEGLQCVVCGFLLSQFKSTTSGHSGAYNSMQKEGRVKDMEQLERSYQTATNDSERLAIKKSMAKINSEVGDRYKRSIREEIVKATREGNTQRLKEIHENLNGDRKYQND